MFGFGPIELLLIVLVLLILFGARKLPELGKGLGQGIREFRKGGQDVQPQELDRPSSTKEMNP
ncbi:hypothetical protein DAETH_37950 (plasmid) [Deinococcus aetherius]|uniref:Sec-independent protein translocase protein TatA n=1 Tax=Deinococcus aetherius TaxID=200252 RepID=A0ABN6RPY2_9DEIO|nr:twin-arginine translocase TatA/TatE family subunit [Deinococcus aetherius]BDP43826.1 hypothetical protein DAETH_37950 [Deinococcus aetherius]